MLSKECKDLVAEIRAARIQAKKFFDPVQYLQDRYMGADYGTTTAAPEPEAIVHQYMSLVLPAVAFDLPKVTINTQRKGTQQATAEAIQQGLNRWMRDTDFRQVETDLARDMLFMYAVALTTQEPVYGAEGDLNPTFRPQVRCLDRRRYFHDPQALSERELRFRGHACVYDKEDLLRLAREDKDDGWIPEAIEALAISDGLSEVMGGAKKPHDTNRKEVVIFEVWVPEHKQPGKEPEDGFHGTIYTVASGQDVGGKEINEFVRKPRAYYGPRWGPYTLIGAYTIPQNTYPSGPLSMCQSQIRTYTEFSKVVLASAAAYKRVIIINKGADPQLAQLIKDGKHDFVFDGVNVKAGDIEVFEIAGATQQMYDQLNLLRENLDRSLATADATRGTVTGEGTATENQLAFSSSSARMAWIKAQFSWAIGRVLKTAAWYLYYDDRVVFPMSGPMGEDGKATDAMFFGGDSGVQKNRKKIGERMREYKVEPPEGWEHGGAKDAKLAGSYDDLELEIELYSMERPGEAVQQRRITELLNLLGATIPVQPGAPWINWQKVYAMAGSAINLPQLSEVINLELLAEMTGFEIDKQQLQMQLARLQGDTGKSSSPPPSMIQPTAGNGKAANSPQTPQRGGSALGSSSGTKASASAGVSVSDTRRGGY